MQEEKSEQHPIEERVLEKLVTETSLEPTA